MFSSNIIHSVLFIRLWILFDFFLLIFSWLLMNVTIASALEDQRRSSERAQEAALAQASHALEEAHKSRLEGVIDEHMKAQDALNKRHSDDMRTRLSEMAHSKDELAQIEKAYALKETTQKFETEMSKAVAEAEARLRNVHVTEVEEIRKECALSIKAIQEQHELEKRRMGGDLMDARDEIKLSAEKVRTFRKLSIR